MSSKKKLVRLSVAVAATAIREPKNPTVRVPRVIVQDIRAELDRLGIPWRI